MPSWPGDFLLRRKHAALELDALEAILIDHSAGLLDHLRGRNGLAPCVGCVGLAGMLCIFVKQVGAVRHFAAHCAAQQVANGQAQHLPLQIEHGYLHGADHLVGVFGGVRARRQFKLHTAVARLPRPDAGAHSGLHFVQLKGRKAFEQTGSLLQHLDHGLIAVGLGNTGTAIGGFHFNNAAQCPRLVDAAGVEQRTVTKRDGRDAHRPDFCIFHLKEITRP